MSGKMFKNLETLLIKRNLIEEVESIFQIEIYTGIINLSFYYCIYEDKHTKDSLAGFWFNFFPLSAKDADNYFTFQTKQDVRFKFNDLETKLTDFKQKLQQLDEWLEGK